MKKLILIFLSLLIVFSLTSCGESKAKNGDSSDSANAESIKIDYLKPTVASIYEHSAVVLSDGTVYATGDNEDGQCDFSSIANVKLP